eukprot:1156964-Pelagomonas_calceolata.AAC.12
MGEVAYDPSAPGAAAASQTQGPVCGAPYIHGPVADGGRICGDRPVFGSAGMTVSMMGIENWGEWLVRLQVVLPVLNALVYMLDTIESDPDCHPRSILCVTSGLPFNLLRCLPVAFTSSSTETCPLP